MHLARFRFSSRTLLIAFGVFAAILALSIRFGPHIVWKTLNFDVSSGVVPIQSKPLVAKAPDGVFVTCQIGPVAFKLPKSMSETIDFDGSHLFCHDGKRVVSIDLPHRDYRLLQREIGNFPDKAKLTFPRLYKEITDAKSSDFSFGMPHRELQWHKWLLSTRSQIGIDINSIEFLWRPDLEGNLVLQSSVSPTFQWATVDGNWEGAIFFKNITDEDFGWIRYLCTTFEINGNPDIFDHRDVDAIKSMIKVSGS